jgi:hypothetical protein
MAVVEGVELVEDPFPTDNSTLLSENNAAGLLLLLLIAPGNDGDGCEVCGGGDGFT